jgi:hypothetical protein
MDTRHLRPDEFRELVEAMLNASHQVLGSLTVHSREHPQLGDIIIVAGKDKDAVLIHGSRKQFSL